MKLFKSNKAIQFYLNHQIIQREIAEYAILKLFARKQPLLQEQMETVEIESSRVESVKIEGTMMLGFVGMECMVPMRAVRAALSDGRSCPST